MDRITAPSTPTGYALFFNGSGSVTLDIQVGNGNEVQGSVVYPTDNAWHHVAVVFATSGPGINPRIFLDGVASGPSPILVGGFANPAPFVIGKGLTGLVDEVEVFSGTALIAADALSIFNADSGGKCALDYGDAPAPYPTLLTNDGARHTLSSLKLGSLSDVESDGQPDPDALGDDFGGLDDEDGVTFGLLPKTGTGSLTAVVSGGPAKLDAWIDFNHDGDWTTVGDKIVDGAAVVNGSNALTFPVPQTASAGNTFARVRLSSAGTADPTGLAADGEVEDYKVTIVPADKQPTQFAFQSKSDVPLKTFIQSNTIVPTGYNVPTKIKITGGKYSIGCTGTFVIAGGTINPGESVCVEVRSAATRSTTTGLTLTIGAVSANFNVTTIPDPPHVNLHASPLSVPSGGAVTLDWNSSGATTCQGAYGTTSWGGKLKPVIGSESSGPIQAPNGTKTFRLVCQNAGGTGFGEVKINVTHP
jgi:hypothetical protein